MKRPQDSCRDPASEARDGWADSAPELSPAPVQDFGIPLAQCCDSIELRRISEGLWSLLDDISTTSDMFKPTDLSGYRLFYEHAMRMAERRNDCLSSDGYILFLTSCGSTDPAPKPTYCCEWCGLGAQELEDGNWLSRLNIGEIPSRWRCQTCDPNNLEGPGPPDEERRANARAISALPVHERFALMFRGPQPDLESR